MSIFQIVVWIAGGIAAYRLWESLPWLAVVAGVAALSYGAHGDEQQRYAVTGEYSTGTATRLLFTSLLVGGIFIYSLVI